MDWELQKPKKGNPFYPDIDDPDEEMKLGEMNPPKMKKEESEVVDADNMFNFMDNHERERAATFYN